MPIPLYGMWPPSWIGSRGSRSGNDAPHASMCWKELILRSSFPAGFPGNVDWLALRGYIACERTTKKLAPSVCYNKLLKQKITPGALYAAKNHSSVSRSVIEPHDRKKITQVYASCGDAARCSSSNQRLLQKKGPEVSRLSEIDP